MITEIQEIHPTKLQRILIDKKIKQCDLIKIIKENTGFEFGKDKISRICSGKIKNVTIETAVMICEALNVKIDDIVEIKNVKKTNRKPK